MASTAPAVSSEQTTRTVTTVMSPAQNPSGQINVVTQGGAAVPQQPGQSSASPPGLANTGQATVTPATISSTGQATAGSATNSSQAAPSSTTTSGPTTPELLSNVATIGRDTTPQIVNSYNTLPVFDVYANVENRDLGGVTSDVQTLVKEFQKKAPTGTILKINGQALTMQTSFVQLGLGLVFAIVLIYLLLTVNFESWIDPLIIVMASPGALCGVLWGLFATKSTFNVPSLMGAIMSVGVATANSILLVTFANDRRAAGQERPWKLHWRQVTRVFSASSYDGTGNDNRECCPMAIGMGDGGEQNAPLGRAVIGGLLVATCTTLIFVPLMYTVMRHAELDPAHPNTAPLPGPPGISWEQLPGRQVQSRKGVTFEHRSFLDDPSNRPTTPGGQPTPTGHHSVSSDPKHELGRMILIVSGVITLIVVLIVGILPRIKQKAALAEGVKAAKTTLPEVTVTKPTWVFDPGISLPGNIEAIKATVINARSTGYLKQLFVDIGSHVTAGEVLGVFQSPDVDQQLNQAQAQTAQSRATVQ